VVRALIGLLESDRAYGQVFNIGNNEEISIMDLARQVREICKSRSDIVLVPYEKAYEQGFEDMPRRVPDITKIHEHIGWKPTIGLPQILADVVEHERRSS
jgi:UDP-glucose 4-epimerase